MGHISVYCALFIVLMRLGDMAWGQSCKDPLIYRLQQLSFGLFRYTDTLKMPCQIRDFGAVIVENLWLYRLPKAALK